MNDSSLYRRIIAEEAGAWAWPVRGALRCAELFYSRIVALRNAHYDRRGPRVTLDVPVISVGNITVGGTGKTPMVMEVVRRLDGMGRSPAVVSRGYGASPGEPNDEERLIRKHCPAAVCVSDSDRALAAQAARRDFGADVIVLDDGFQHRRLARSLDIVLVDATCPFGFDHLLPRGLLREPVAGLRRAGVIVLTRCDQVPRTTLARIEAKLKRLAGDVLHLKCNHRVSGLEHLDGTTVQGSLAGKRVVLFAGIAQPRSFTTTVRSIGADVVGQRWWPDHYRYRRRDLDALRREGRFPSHDYLVTTEKDAVKLTALEGIAPSEVVVVKIAIDFVGDHGTMLQDLLSRAVDHG